MINVKLNKKLKFNIIFENLEEIGEVNQNEKDEELKEEDLVKDKSNDDEILIKRKDSIIKIKLFESVNGGYVVRFSRNQGEIEDFHKHLDNIKIIIKNLL